MSLPRPGPRVPWRALLLAAVAGMCSGCALLPPGWRPGEAAPATAAAPSPPARPEFELVVQAPEPLRAMLLRYLDIARLQQLPADERLGNAEFNRIVAGVPAQAQAMLQTEGYFDAQVTVQREDERVPEGRRSAVPGRVRVQVAPGPSTRVAGIALQPQGPLQQQLAAGDAEARALWQGLSGGGPLRAGDVFRNADWQAAKQQWLARLRSAGYAAATLVDSQATVQAERQQADLAVRIDSGPRFLAGPVEVTGLVHHDEAMVQALAGLRPGSPLTEARLTEYQDRLQKTRLFTSVSVGFDTDPAAADRAPVRVRLVELPLQQATLGAGVSANTGPRVTLEHTHRRPLDWPLVAANKLEWGRDSQSWAGDFQTHPGEGYYRHLLGVQIERVVSDTDVVLSQRLRLGRNQDTPRIERLYFLELLRSRQDDLPGAVRQGSGPSAASALSANLHWTWRDLDDPLLPTRGLSLALQAGAGHTAQHGGPDGPFGRLYGRLTGYLPLRGGWYGSARVEAGQLLYRPGLHLPDALGFRAGGDESVRGYAWRSLAPTDDNGSTVSGDKLLTASVEVARPLVASMPTLWGALFVDAGRAVTDWHDYQPAWGYGAGLRWRSPIGPLRIDLARAHELKKFRLHFSVGISF